MINATDKLTTSDVDQGRVFNMTLQTSMLELMVRLAALQGEVLLRSRLLMVLQGASEDKPLPADLPEMATQIWLSQFPEGRGFLEPMAGLPKTSFPCLWFSTDNSKALLVKARSANGSYLAEDAAGNRVTLSREDAQIGVACLLLAKVQVADGRLPITAKDWFTHTLKKYRREFGYAILATFLVSLVGLFSALYTMQVYDRVIPTKGYSTLFVLTVGVLIAVAGELFLKQVRAYLVDRICKMIDVELSEVFFAKALQIRLDARPRTVGTFASQVRHFESVRGFMTSATLFVLADTPFAVLFIFVIALIAGPVALVPVVMLLSAFLVGWWLKSPIEKLASKNMKESNEKNGLLIDAIDGIESVKASNAEWKVIARWRELTERMSVAELKLRGLTALSSNTTQTLQQLSYIGLVAWGAYSVTEGNLTMGGLIACTLISGRALAPLAQIPGMISAWKHAQIALEGLNQIMSLPSDRSADARLVIPDQCMGVLEAKEAAFQHADSKHGISVKHLKIEPGERVAVLGQVGSGKSTLIKLLAGLYAPSAGHVYLDGVDQMHLSPEYVREQLGYLPQDVRLFEGTLRDNLTLGLPAPTDTHILAAAALTGLDSVIKGHPKGLDLAISEGGKGLSGGQRQLVGLTRMLLASPRVMLLDEPTASLDAELESKVIKHLFSELAPDRSLVVVTHKLGFLAYVNRILVVERGKVVLDGPRDSIARRLRLNVPVAVPLNQPGVVQGVAA